MHQIQAPNATYEREQPDFEVTVKRLFIIGLTFLASLTAVKLGEIESVEIYTWLALGLIAALVYRNRLCLRAHRSVLLLLRAYLIFLISAAALAFWALTQPSFPPPGTPLLNTAPYLSIARLIQFADAIGALLLTAELICSRPPLCLLIAQSYVYAGVISAAYSLVSWVALLGDLDLGGAYRPGFFRARGFFVEGGPFGVYLVSVILVCIFRRHVLHRGDPRAYWFQLTILFIALAASASKAAIILAVLLTVYYIVTTRRVRYLVAFAPIFAGLALAANFATFIRHYAENYVHFSLVAEENPYDTNVIQGRLMAAILVPTMVEHHPITGVGIGNYSLQRNNPLYLGPLPTSVSWDLPGLGLLGYTAELGIPLLLYLCWLLWRPVALSRRAGAPAIVVLLGAYQLFAHIMGVQPTFVYPWIVSGLALGYTLSRCKPCDTPSAVSTARNGAS
jgi:hypothetical protein